MKAGPAESRVSLGERARIVLRRLRGGTLSPGRAAASVGVGLFVGMWPIYGFQFFLIFVICWPLRLDVAVAYVAAHVSNPLTLPFLLALELEIGSLLLTGRHAPHNIAGAKSLGAGPAILELCMGSLLLGLATGMVGSMATWIVAQRVRDSRARTRAIARKRTMARYALMPPNVRFYVLAKLRTDPAFSSVADLGPMGRVIDAGCGFGQLGLGLLDIGNATSLFGIDEDEERVRIAQQAASGDAQFVAASLVTADLPESDSILFVDSLHYLDVEVQDAVLARTARVLAPGGRLVVREVDVRPTLRSVLTQWLERRAMKRYGRPGKPGFRPARQFAAALERLGLVTEIFVHEDWSLFDNALIVGRKPLPALDPGSSLPGPKMERAD